MTYKITLKKRVLKALEDINEPYYSKVKNAIYSLADNPRPQGCKKLKGRDGYRIIYDIFDSTLLVDVINIGHRKDIYE